MACINVQAPPYGAKGDGVTDDTAAIQAALTAACATQSDVYLPEPTAGYVVTDTLTIQPTGTIPFARVNIAGAGYSNAIRWAGPSGRPVFKALAWKRSKVTGLHIDLSNAPAGTTGVIGWDIDTTATYSSTSNVTFDTCFVGLGGNPDSVGWRLGHLSGGSADVSFYNWLNCNVTARKGTTGTRGWLNEGKNALNNCWFGGDGIGLEKMVSNVGGNDSMFFYGLGGSSNAVDFELACPGAYVISGGRFELGARFMDVLSGSNHASVVVQGVNLSTYAPADGTLVKFDRPGSLIWDGNYVRGGTAGVYTASAFKLGGFTGLGTLTVRGGAMTASDPFFTAPSNWQVWVQGVGVLNASNQTTARMATRLGA